MWEAKENYMLGWPRGYVKWFFILTLYINNPEICPNCTRNLPSMLPFGASLTVVIPDGTAVTFVGK